MSQRYKTQYHTKSQKQQPRSTAHMGRQPYLTRVCLVSTNLLGASLSQMAILLDFNCTSYQKISEKSAALFSRLLNHVLITNALETLAISI